MATVYQIPKETDEALNWYQPIMLESPPDFEIRFRNVAQVALWDNEICGQISDGTWENAEPDDHWKAWAKAKPIVIPWNVGRNFPVLKDDYDLQDLVSLLGDRMRAYMEEVWAVPVSESDLITELADMERIMKIGPE